KPGLSPLVELVKDPDDQVRLLALMALGGAGPDAAPATDAISAALAARDPEVRRFAARALGRIGPAARRARPALTRLLEDRDSALRAAASVALDQIGTGKGKRSVKP